MASKETDPPEPPKAKAVRQRKAAPKVGKESEALGGGALDLESALRLAADKRRASVPARAKTPPPAPSKPSVVGHADKPVAVPELHLPNKAVEKGKGGGDTLPPRTVAGVAPDPNPQPAASEPFEAARRQLKAMLGTTPGPQVAPPAARPAMTLHGVAPDPNAQPASLEHRDVNPLPAGMRSLLSQELQRGLSGDPELPPADFTAEDMPALPNPALALLAAGGVGNGMLASPIIQERRSSPGLGMESPTLPSGRDPRLPGAGPASQEPHLAPETAAMGDTLRPVAPTVGAAELDRLDLRVAEIVSMAGVPASNGLIRVAVSLGGEAIPVLVAADMPADPAALVGRSTILIANLEPSQTRFGLSHGGLLLGGLNGRELVLLDPASASPIGKRLR